MHDDEKYQYFVAHEFSKEGRIDLRSAIKDAFENTDLIPYYADLEVRPEGATKYILEKIKEKILATQFGIYDITTEKQNVFIELGIAIGFDKPYYIIRKIDLNQKERKIPADLEGIDRIEYEAYGELTGKIKELIVKPEVERLRKRKALKNAIEKYEKLPEETILNEGVNVYQSTVDFSHRFGEEVEDRDAHFGRAWLADLSSQSTHFIFGPYEALPSSRSDTYIALFKIKVNDNSPANRFIHFDVTSGNGSVKYSSRYINKEEFEQPNKYQFFGVAFEYPGKGASIEYRIRNRTTFKSVKVWCDYIAIMKVV
ncbi:MAG: hypothetical protein WC568_09705 [Candidatus Methanoperedens sp.]